MDKLKYITKAIFIFFASCFVATMILLFSVVSISNGVREEYKEFKREKENSKIEQLEKEINLLKSGDTL